MQTQPSPDDPDASDQTNRQIKSNLVTSFLKLTKNC
jgi:hypothetical protein